MNSQWGRITAGAVALAATGALVVGGVALFAPAAESPEPVAAVSSYTTETVQTADYLTAARDDKAARDEAARVAAEQKAAEEAAALAAAQEAERVAAEQAAAVEEPVWEEPVTEEPVYEEPAPEEPSSGTPVPWKDLGNGTGIWDFSACPTQSGSTGADGVVYCAD